MRAAICGVTAGLCVWIIPLFIVKSFVERFQLQWMRDYLLVELLAYAAGLALLGLSYWVFWLVHNWVDMKVDKWHNERGSDFKLP